MLATTKETLREGAAAALGLLVQVTCNANATTNNTVIVCPDLPDKAVDNERFKNSFIWRAESEWRLVSAVDVDNATITVRRGWTTNNTINAVFSLYGVLNPDEWGTAINAAVKDKFYKDRLSVPLVAGQTEYNCNTWIQSKGQIIRMRWRDVQSGATKPAEDEVAVAFPTETNHTVTIIVPSQPTAPNTTLIIEARHYYDGGLVADNASVTLPGRLAEVAVKHEALKLIFQKLGAGAKKIFGQQMVLTERELAEQESRWLDTGAKRDWSVEDEPFGGDEQGGPSWGW